MEMRYYLYNFSKTKNYINNTECEFFCLLNFNKTKNLINILSNNLLMLIKL